MDERTAREKRDEDEAPEPERMITPEEEAGMDLAALDDPPQAEGKRDPEYQELDGGNGSRDRARTPRPISASSIRFCRAKNSTPMAPMYAASSPNSASSMRAGFTSPGRRR